MGNPQTFAGRYAYVAGSRPLATVGRAIRTTPWRASGAVYRHLARYPDPPFPLAL